MCQSRVLPSHLLRFQSLFILFLSYLGLTVRLIIALFSVANIESSKSCAYHVPTRHTKSSSRR